jgi:hypothetical protein
MAKSTKKKSYPPKNNKSQPQVEVKKSQQSQPAPYTKEKLINKEKESSSNFPIFFLFLVFAFFLLMFNSVSDQLMTRYALSNALSYGYLYSSYIEKNMTFFDIIFSAIFCGIVLSYVLVIWAMSDSCGHHSSGGSISGIIGRIINWWIAFPFIAIIPFIIFCNIYHHNIDELMYENINKLYQKVSQDPKFEQTPMNARFQKAIEEKDYETLKELSSNINSLAKLTPEQLITLEDGVSKLPLSKIRKDFEKFSDGYTSYAEYLDFYDKSQKLFNNSEYKDIPKYVSQMKKLKITYYDYEPIKRIID